MLFLKCQLLTHIAYWIATNSRLTCVEVFSVLRIKPHLHNSHVVLQHISNAVLPLDVHLKIYCLPHKTDNQTNNKLLRKRILQIQPKQISNKTMLPCLKITNGNSYNENDGNSFTQLAKAIWHVMTVHMANPWTRNPLNAAATLPDLSRNSKTLKVCIPTSSATAEKACIRCIRHFDMLNLLGVDQECDKQTDKQIAIRNSTLSHS